MEGSSVRARSDFAESASGGCRASVSHLCRKMSLCNTYRSFAIFLSIVILISESPVSAFTIRRTTTLRPADPDLAAERSALLEIKSDLSKLNNERDYVKYGTRKSPIRNSENVLGADKIFASGKNKNIIESTTVKLPNENNVPKPTENKTMRKEMETTTHPIFGEEEKFKTISESAFDAAIENITSIPKSSMQSSLNTNITNIANTNISNTSNTKENSQVLEDNYKHNKSRNVKDNDHFSTSTEWSEVDGSKTEEGAHILNTRFTTTYEPVHETSTTITESYKETTINAEAVNEKNIYKIIKKTTTPPTDTTNFKTDSTKLNDVEKISTLTESTAIAESMVGEFSSSPNNDPSWKKYTTIERRRTHPTTETESSTTETLKELEKAESVTSKVILENAVSSTTQQKQDPVSDSTTTLETEYVNLSTTVQSFDNVPESKTEHLLSTQALSAETTTELKSQDFLASRRAGYLNLSEKQDADEASTTEQYDVVKFNETELLGSMFEIDTQDDWPELKNSTIVESQSQLAEDAIKEELLKEELLSDHVENSQRYNEELQSINKVKPLDVNRVDSLSVKPIGKGALYTSRSNYRPMKKIEVQPLKPYVRDPDDNSWRNESLSYLGIVFNAKNASKPFTQVLKNKTEAELNNWTEKDSKNEVPDLRERLEKIAEVRKSKKKKINRFGEMVYNDYEADNSGETSSTPKTDAVSIPVMEVEGELLFHNPPTTTSVKIEAATRPTTTLGVYMYKEETVATTKKPKKINKFAEYYDTTDEEDADYLSLSKIDLKKFTTRLFAKENEKVTTPPPMTMFTKPMKTMIPERRPTLQYFPPRREPQKVNINDYDNDFQRKVNMFAYSEPQKSTPNSDTIPPATVEYETTQHLKGASVIPGPGRQYKPGNLAKNVYATFPPRVVDHNNRYPPNNDESFNRASYVIKHFKDLIDEAVKDDYDKSAEFMPPYTEAPLTGLTVKKGSDQLKMHMDDDYDYDAHFRKDILNRFVDNFNQNSERFKVDFPILYNSSVVHMQADDSGKVVASSSAFLKRQYGSTGRPCCDMKVELSPAYELHYYVPDQEENEEVEKPATMPFSYRL